MGKWGGKQAGAGRPKGVPNKLNRDIKEMVVGALQDVGGRDYLAARALDQPVAFMGLIGRVLPLQVTGENGGALVVDFRWADATPPPTIEAVADEITSVADETSISVTFVDTDTDVFSVRNGNTNPFAAANADEDGDQTTNVDTDVGEC